MEAMQGAYVLCLLDFYGALLTKRQREMMALRLEEDLSLSEIAENYGVSRQAVHDALRRAELTLIDMEKKLMFYERTRKAVHGAQSALAALEDGDIEGAKRCLSTLAVMRGEE